MNKNRVWINSIICLLVVAGCAKPGPVVEAPPAEVTLPAEVEALPAAPPRVVSETEELQLALSEAAGYIDKGQLKEAAAIYDEALEKMPRSAELHYNLGNVHLQSGLIDEAIAEYNKALEITPEDKDLRVNLGTAYYERDMVDAAIDEYKKALAIDPDDPEAHYNLGVAYENKGLQAEAEKEFGIYRKLTGKPL